MIRESLSIAGGVLGLFLWVSAADAEVANCTPINTLPTVITVQGIYCLKQDLATSMTTGNAITINTNNVIIDMNGFKLGGLAGGPATRANGVAATNRQNITIRNGNIRGFRVGVSLQNTTTPPTSSGHLVEDLRVETSRFAGINLSGTSSIIRRNFIFGTIGSGAEDTSAYGVYVTGSRSVSITDNVVKEISNLSALSTMAFGIRVSGSTSTNIMRNEVTNLISTYAPNGITTGGGTYSIVRDNIVSTQSLGFIGIDAGDDSDVCSGNVAVNFYYPTLGC
jgi:hypothetical protein